MKIQKVCIYGAGAIGGWLGARLGLAGYDVSVVARGATLEAIQSHGLRLEDAGKVIPVTVQVNADPAALGVQDLIIIAVKAPALLGVAKSLAPLMGPDTTVLTAMNGVPWWFLHGLQGASKDARIQSVDKDGQMGKLIPIEQVIGCVVHASCSLNGPGFVKHHFGNDLIVGSPSGGETVRSLAVAAVLNRAGFSSSVSERIQNDVWYKLWGNMTVNTVSAITGATTDAILDDDLIRGFMSRVMLEAKEIGARLGISISQEPEDRHAVTRKLGAFKTSMLQDVEAGRPTELDALVGAVKDLGSITAVATPFTDALFGLARLNLKLKTLY